MQDILKMISGIAVVANLLITSGSPAQPLHKQQIRPSEYVENVKKRPDLGVDYNSVAKFKLASRKTNYRIGEMISIDLAIMNVSDSPLLFHVLSRPLLVLTARNEEGALTSVNDYTTALEATSPNAYRQIEPSHLMLTSFELVAGCTNDVHAFLDRLAKLESEQFGRGEAAYFKGLFDREMFVNWGQACFAVQRPGKYIITAEQSNDIVVVSSSTPKLKTAVGEIRSTPLRITITD